MSFDLTYRKKFIYGILLFVLILFGLHKKNNSKILTYKNELDKLENNQIDMVSEVTRIRTLKNEISRIEGFIGDSRTKPDKIQRKIVDNFSEDENISINLISPIHEYNENNFKINSFSIMLKGGYQDLFNSLKKAEEKLNITKIVSTTFLKKMNFNTRKEELFLEIIFQNYEKK